MGQGAGTSAIASQAQQQQVPVMGASEADQQEMANRFAAL